MVDQIDADIIGDHTGNVIIPVGDERFKCSCCGKAIRRSGKPFGENTGMYVDSDRMIWCSTCFFYALDNTVRSVKKNPDDRSPKIYHDGGRYYRVLRNDRVKGYRW